jgi:DNA-binding NarL/FixJ family response regulator
MIRVLLAGNGALEPLLEADGDIDVVGVAAERARAVDLARAKGRTSSSWAYPRTRSRRFSRSALADPTTSLIALSGRSDRAHVVAAMRAGARGYVFDDGDVPALLRAVRAAARGDYALDPRAARELLRDGGIRIRVRRAVPD